MKKCPPLSETICPLSVQVRVSKFAEISGSCGDVVYAYALNSGYKLRVGCGLGGVDRRPVIGTSAVINIQNYDLCLAVVESYARQTENEGVFSRARFILSLCA